MAATHLLRRIFLSAVVCASATPSFALDPDRSLAQLHHTAWTAEDGAPSQISAIDQTADGYLWIGSARGLFRFDGVEFERYVPPDGVSLPSHNIYNTRSTPDGGLWISFRPSGLGFLKDGRLTTFVGPDDIPSSQLYKFGYDLDGRLFAGTHDGLVIREGHRWVPFPDSNLPPGRVLTMFIDRDGTLWVVIAGKMLSLARGSTAFVHRGNKEWASKMSQAPDGWIWIAGEHVTAIPGSGDNLRRAPVYHQRASDILIDRDGCLWVATANDGLQRVASPAVLKSDVVRPGDARIESIRESQGLSDDAVHLVFEDREGNIWAGTGKGIDRFRHSHFVPVTLPPGYESLTLLPDAGGDVWVGTSKGQPLMRVGSAGVEATNESMAVASVCRDNDGVIWWGAISEVVRQHGDTFRSYPLFKTPLGEWLWEVFPSDIDGALWVSVGDRGLHHFRDGVWETRPQPAGLPDRGPSASYVAPDGRTWLGYTENRVCVLDRGTVRAYTRENGIEIGRVRVIRGRASRIWVGGELGLALFDGERFRTVASALPTPFGTVSGIIERADGSLWLNEVNGVQHIPAGEVMRVVHDPAHRVRARLYDVQEGLPGAGQMNFNCSTAAEATDGKLWFATDGGLAWIDPAHITTNPLAPPVVIRSIATEDSVFGPRDPIRLDHGTATLRIDYTALSLSIPERVQFRYRLAGYDEHWVEAGTRRTAFYTRLRPGSYQFQVVASNNDAVWNWTGATASFAIAPAFYQTGWFAAACVAGVLLSLWIVHRVRVRQVASRLQRLHEERIDERMRIAHELHDTLLQGFLSASMQLQVARDAIVIDTAAKQQVGDVLGLMDGVIGEARDAVRGLRAAESVELERAFARIPHEMGMNGGVEFRVAVEGAVQPLRPTARDEVYRIGRESIANALRHAGARRIEAEINFDARELRVVVRDDGRSIDADVLRSGRDGHFGLSGMRERARRLGAQLTVRSGPDAGTEVELVVPARIAFTNGMPASGLVRATRWLRARAAVGRKGA